MNTKITNKNCPCSNKQCAYWGKCVPCRKQMASEGAKPVCEWK